jgi:hypothetical protein
MQQDAATPNPGAPGMVSAAKKIKALSEKHYPYIPLSICNFVSE